MAQGIANRPQSTGLHMPRPYARSAGQSMFPGLWRGLKLGGMPGQNIGTGSNLGHTPAIFDIVMGKPAVVPAVPQIDGEVGPYGGVASMSSSEASSNDNFLMGWFTATDVPFSDHFSVMFFGSYDGGNGADYTCVLAKGGVFSNDSQFALGFRNGTPSTPFFYARNVATLLGAEGGTYIVGDDVVMIGTWDSTNTSQVTYLDGVSVLTSSSGAPTDGTDRFTLGGADNSGTDKTLLGKMYVYAYWDRVLSAGEVQILSLNPFALFQPKSISLGFVAAGAPAAVARRRVGMAMSGAMRI